MKRTRKSISAHRRNFWQMDCTKQGELFPFSCYARDKDQAIERARSILGDIKIHTIERLR